MAVVLYTSVLKALNEGLLLAQGKNLAHLISVQQLHESTGAITKGRMATFEEVRKMDNSLYKVSDIWTTTNTLAKQLVFDGFQTVGQLGKPLRDVNIHEVNNRQVKIFVHFAKQFVERFPKWEIQPEPDDPFHQIKVVRRDIGAALFIHPGNQLIGIFGGPSVWTREQNAASIGDTSYVARVQMEVFYGWAIGLGDEPEWIR